MSDEATQQKEQRGGYEGFYDQVLEVTRHDLCHILFGLEVSLAQCEEREGR